MCNVNYIRDQATHTPRAGWCPGRHTSHPMHRREEHMVTLATMHIGRVPKDSFMA